MVLALGLSQQNVKFVVLRHDQDAKKYDRFVQASVLLTATYKNFGGTAEFFYSNIETDIFNLTVKIGFVNPTALLNTLHKSMSLVDVRPILVPYSITDYYRGIPLLRGNASPLSEMTKEQVYALAQNLQVPLKVINEYRRMDIETAEHMGLTHKEIEWAHFELQKSGWDSYLNNDYTEEQRDALLFARARGSEAASGSV
jgi:hypothetical protein